MSKDELKDIIKELYFEILEDEENICNESTKTNDIPKEDLNKKYHHVAFFKGKMGAWNSVAYMQEEEINPHRGRSEAIVIKDGKILIDKANKDNINGTYCVPGGGWDKGEDHKNAALRECREEVLIEVKNPQYVGSYITHKSKVSAKIKINVPKKYWWKDFYTEVYLCEYVGKYEGKVPLMDRDSMARTGKWYEIDKIYDELNPIHKKAVDIWRRKH